MPSTQAIIGRVGVKVLPDTKDFRREAEKALGKIEKTIKVSIPTMLDMTGAKRDMLEQIRKINQENRSMDSRKIRFHTTISRDTMNETISRAVRQLNERAAVRKIKFGEMEVELALDQFLRQPDIFRNGVEPVEQRHRALQLRVLRPVAAARRRGRTSGAARSTSRAAAAAPRYAWRPCRGRGRPRRAAPRATPTARAPPSATRGGSGAAAAAERWRWRTTADKEAGDDERWRRQRGNQLANKG